MAHIDYDKHFDNLTNAYLDESAGKTVSFECDVYLALPTDTENARVRECKVTGQIVEAEYEFIPSGIIDTKNGKVYSREQLVDESELYDYAYDANYPNRQGDEIDRDSREYKSGRYVTAK